MATVGSAGAKVEDSPTRLGLQLSMQEHSIGQTGCLIDSRSALDKQLSSERDLCSAINTDSPQEGLLRPSTLAQSQVHHGLFFFQLVSFFHEFNPFSKSTHYSRQSAV